MHRHASLLSIPGVAPALPEKVIIGSRSAAWTAAIGSRSAAWTAAIYAAWAELKPLVFQGR